MTNLVNEDHVAVFDQARGGLRDPVLFAVEGVLLPPNAPRTVAIEEPVTSCSTAVGVTPVSYTHLDVYKRQAHAHADNRSALFNKPQRLFQRLYRRQRTVPGRVVVSSGDCLIHVLERCV